MKNRRLKIPVEKRMILPTDGEQEKKTPTRLQRLNITLSYACYVFSIFLIFDLLGIERGIAIFGVLMLQTIPVADLKLRPKDIEWFANKLGNKRVTAFGLTLILAVISALGIWRMLTKDGPNVRVIATASISIYNGPGQNQYPRIGIMGKDDSYFASGISPDGEWLLLQVGSLDGTPAWVERDKVNIEGNLSNLSIQPTPTNTFTPTLEPPTLTYTPSITASYTQPSPPTASPTPSTPEAYPKHGSVPVRPRPDSSLGTSLGLSFGQRVIVLGVSEDSAWYKVLLENGNSGWVQAQFLEVAGNPALIAVIIEPNYTPTAIPTPSTPEAYPKHGSVPVRPRPDSSLGTSLGLSFGQRVIVLGVSEDSAWYKVLLENGNSGWVQAQFLEVAGNPALIAVMTEPTYTPTWTPTLTPSDTPTPTTTPTYTPISTSTSEAACCLSLPNHNAEIDWQYVNVWQYRNDTGTPSDRPDESLHLVESRDAAKSYCQQRGMRLPTPDEWRAAADMPGFVIEEGRWEWVIDEQGEDSLMSKSNGVIHQEPVTDFVENITFRCAKPVST